jgi:methylmalonyl-CoA mutase cobalamin-binding domain/chain
MAMTDWQALRDRFLDSLLKGDSDQALSLSRQVLSQEIKPVDFFENCIAPSLEDVGKRFERIEIFLPEMASAGEIVQKINDELIEPLIERRPADSDSINRPATHGKVLLATVRGDIHDIGKNMVGLMLRVSGFEVLDIGTNVPPLEIVEEAEREEVDIIGLSSLLTTCLPYMKDVMSYLEAKGIRERFKVIIGGASPTFEFAEQIGADALGKSAPEAVAICKEMMKIKSQV